MVRSLEFTEWNIMDDTNVAILVNYMQTFGTWIIFIVDVHLLLSAASIECHRILFMLNFKRVFCNPGAYCIISSSKQGQGCK